MAEADQDEPASTASAEGDMVNRYTYYVTTTEVADKLICANVGDVYYTCENGQDEYAKINSIHKRSYSYDDFIASASNFSTSYTPLNVHFIKLKPRSGFYIRKIKEQGQFKYDGDRLVMQGAKNTAMDSHLRSNVWYVVKPGLNNVNLSIPYFDYVWKVYKTPVVNTDDGNLYIIESSKDGDNFNVADMINGSKGTANPSYNNGTDTTYVKDIEGWDRHGNPFVIYLRDKGFWYLNIYENP
jgi:hypothetical protein